MRDFSEILKTVPKKPGVYTMKDDSGRIIYVGKAKNLKNRLTSYFTGISSHDAKTKILVKHIDGFDYVVTSTEKEALILENNQIKKHKPKYNIRLKDDKTYPYIKITSEMFPKLEKVRKIQSDGASYYGPYTSALNVNRTIDVLNRIFPIRKCNRDMKKLYNKPCLYYHMGSCLAPCIKKGQQDAYGEAVEEISDFLKKGSSEIISALTEKMKTEAEKLNFERAGIIRDQIESLKSLKERQNMSKLKTAEMDVISAYTNGEKAYVVVFFVRNNVLYESEKYLFEDLTMDGVDKIIEQFIQQFYGATAYIPSSIEVMCDFEGMDVLEDFLSDKKTAKVKIRVPKRGEKKQLIDLAEKNATMYLEKLMTDKDKRRAENMAVLKSLSELIGMEPLPRRIEIYDISNIMGTFSVGSMVVYVDGEKKSSEYRKFKIKSVGHIDDYASIMEVIFRRHKRGVDESAGFEVFADLLVIDGGKGHVTAAKDSLNALGLNHLEVMGLVKDDKHRTRAVYHNGKVIELDKHSELFRFLSNMQEEVHRFAINYHRSLRNKGMFSSVLDDIEGVGKKRKAELLNHFGSVDAIKNAGVYELEQVDGINSKVAESIIKYFSKTK